MLHNFFFLAKVNDEIGPTIESEMDQMRLENNEKGFKRRRHEKSTCLLCSTKDSLMEAQNAVRNRKTSTSSIHRIRTGILEVLLYLLKSDL